MCVRERERERERESLCVCVFEKEKKQTKEMLRKNHWKRLEAGENARQIFITGEESRNNPRELEEIWENRNRATEEGKIATKYAKK